MRLGVALLALTMASTAHGFYRCENQLGEITFQDMPCSNDDIVVPDTVTPDSEEVNDRVELVNLANQAQPIMSRPGWYDDAYLLRFDVNTYDQAPLKDQLASAATVLLQADNSLSNNQRQLRSQTLTLTHCMRRSATGPDTSPELQLTELAAQCLQQLMEQPAAKDSAS